MADGSNLPLAINLVGPLALQQKDTTLEVWLPKVEIPPPSGSGDPMYKHEVGIATGVDSRRLYPGDYSLSGPTPASDWPDPYNPDINGQPSEIYSLKANSQPMTYIHITLPRPWQIVGLAPEQCKMVYNGTAERDYKYRATGVRLLYEETGFPRLTGTLTNGDSFNWHLPIDIAPEDQQVEVSINYHPFVHDSDASHPEAKSDFKKIAEMVGVNNLEVVFPVGPFVGPAHDCINPVAMI